MILSYLRLCPLTGDCHIGFKTWNGDRNMSNEKLYTNGNLCSIITFAIIVRWTVALYPYSGQNLPPMFGDYEAQRHWMEITVNLPPNEWYFNTSNNDLMYWGLDYPPLTAYHSYVNGKLAHFINPEFVKLHTSKGYESYDHKFFMRATVIVADVLVYFVALILFFNSIYKNYQNSPELKHGEVSDKGKPKTGNLKFSSISVTYLAQIGIALLYPGLIMIDHGHFQYNSVSLGFTIGAVTALVYNKFLVSSFLFVLALNYKQMSLYHSLPFFIYILSHCLPSNKFNNFKTCSKRFFCTSLTVIVTFFVIWYPFLAEKEISLQVLKRLFPLSRGIFEDKVSNVWCAVNVIYKVNKMLTQAQMVKACVALVIFTSIPSLINLFKHPTIVRLLLALINVSLSFFLFSYQVHEKSILLVALPVILYFPFNPFPCFWFLMMTNFSMLPLFIKDNLVIPFVSLSVLFTLFTFASVNIQPYFEKKSGKSQNTSFVNINYRFVVSVSFILSLIVCFLLFLCSLYVTPPAKYPDLWPLLTSVYSCFHFCLFCLYFNYVQIFKVVD